MRLELVEAIEECEIEEVWDISLTGKEEFYKQEPNFIAQNILVHNSHAAGIVISPIPLAEICPLHLTRDSSGGKERIIATQFDMHEVESQGLIKMDFLGLSTKTALAEAVKLIKINKNINIDLSNLPLDDTKTLFLLNSGKTDGCFQAEEHGMQATFRQIGIDSFDDLIVSIAMFRPGPLDYIPEFAKRKKDPNSVRYVHPVVEKYTKRTYGVIAYQETAMQIFVELAGLTSSEGYIFIKGSAKKNPELFQSMKNRFIKGATKLTNETIANSVWKQMEPFQGYAFNKSLSFSEKIITSEKEISIQELYNRKRRGEILPSVYSPEGSPIEIIDVYDHGVIPTWEVEFGDGSKHVCTLDHKFMTDQGIYPLCEIIEYNLPVIQNWEIKNAKEERLDLPWLSSKSVEPKGIHKTQEKVRGIQIEQEGFCLPRLRAKIHETRASFSQETVSTMEDNEVSSLLGIEWKNINKILERNQRRSRKACGIQESNVRSSICSNFIQRKRNSSPILSNEEIECSSQNTISKEQDRNCYQNIRSIKHIKNKIRSTQKMERGKPRGFHKEVCFACNEAKQMAFSPRIVPQRRSSASRFQALANHKKQEIHICVEKETNRLQGPRPQSNRGIRRTISFCKSPRQQEFIKKSTKRFRGEQSALSMGVSNRSNFLRYLGGSSQKIQISMSSTTFEFGIIMPRERCRENNWQEVRVVNIKYVGLKQCYDLEVDSSDHLYCLSSGIINANSHATAYAHECFKTAYLKAHFELEFMSARLSVVSRRREFEKVVKYEKDAQRHGIKILPADLNRSKSFYATVGERELLRPLIVKGIGDKAAEDIIKHQPYKGADLMYAFASKIGSSVTVAVVATLIDEGLFGKSKKKKAQLLRDFETIKSDRRKSRGRRVGGTIK